MTRPQPDVQETLVTLTGAVRTCFAKYATFSGRAGRREYWWFFLFCVIVSILTSILDAYLGTGFESDSAVLADQGVVSSLVTLLLLLPNLAVGARRLHDTGRSGWWQLLFVIPCVGVIVLIVFFATAGDRMPNKYGDVPAT
jgi:uncharacterized membrane protein YhaH (DUF805 family)